MKKVLRSETLHFALLVTIGLTSPATRAEKAFTPDAVKFYVEHDRMYRVTGKAIAEAFQQANQEVRKTHALGEERFTAPGATSPTEEGEESLVSWGDTTRARAVSAREATGSETAGPRCIQVESGGGDISAVWHPSHELHLKGGERYEVTCRVFTTEPFSKFNVTVKSHISGLCTTYNVANSTVYHEAPAGRWTQLRSRILLPDTGTQKCVLRLGIHVKAPVTWFLDAVSLRAIEAKHEAVTLRPLSEAEEGFELSGLRADTVNLYCQGRCVPILIENLTPQRCFQPETALTFWATRPKDQHAEKNRHTRQNVYVLPFRSEDPPCRYKPAGPGPKPAHPQTAAITRLPKTVRIEKDSLLQHYQPFKGRTTDRVMWTAFESPPREKGHWLHMASLPDIAPGRPPSMIRMLLWGASDLPKNPDHHWRIDWNGVPIGTARWDGYTGCVFESGGIAEAFRPGAKYVSHFVNGFEDGSIDAICLDWIELDYEARLIPQDDMTAFNLPALNDAANLKLGPGFSGPPLRLFSEDGLLIETDPAALASEGSSLLPCKPEWGGRAFRACGPAAFNSPKAIRPGYKNPLPTLRQAPEYLIITHRRFLGPLEPLAAQRRKQGLDTMLVDVESIYDAYSHGLFSPQALRDFLDGLFRLPSANGTGLKYVFLVGDATHDYYGLKQGTPNLVPTHHSDTTGILTDYAPTVALDQYFVLGPGGGEVPKAALGRLPSTDPEVVRAYVDKVIAFEAAESTPPDWARHAVLLATHEFTGYTQQIEGGILRGRPVTHIKGTHNPADAPELQAELLSAINAGCGLLYFAGHGGHYVWRMGEATEESSLFTKEDMASLTNRGQYPIGFTSTCFSNLFDATPRPYYTADSGVGVYFVEAANSGGVALIGHTGKVTLMAGHQFCERVMRAMVEEGVARLGAAFLAAKQQYNAPVHRGIALIGDPALYLGNKYRKEEGTS